MRMRFLIALSVLGLIDNARALHLVQEKAAHVLYAPIQRREYQDNAGWSLEQRSSGTVQEQLANSKTVYYADLALGTPGQSLKLNIDTGSSDLWANTPSSTFCAQSDSPCQSAGMYSANDSSTYQYLNSDFSVKYVDGSSASGDYATDTLQFAGITLSAVQFGIGYTSSSQEGVLGLGYMTSEAQVVNEGQTAYPNLPQLLKSNGAIQACAYSLWLDDLNASTGSLLFGGVDESKFYGPLATVPIIPTNDEYNAFVIGLTGISLNGTTSIAERNGIPVLLDSGSTLSYLPVDVANNIISNFGAAFGPGDAPAAVPCSLASDPTTIEFTFSSQSAKISVPMSELVLNSGAQNGDASCTFGIAPTNNSVSVLGDTFLRNAYVVFDLDRNQVSLAQTNFNPTSPSKILEIQPPPANVPDAKVVSHPVGKISGLENGYDGNSGAVETSGSPNVRRLEASTVGLAVLAIVTGLVWNG